MTQLTQKVGAPPKGAGGLLSRSPDGKLALYVNIMYKGTDINGGKPQQLKIGASGLQVFIGNTNARALGIPMSICSQNEDTHKGRFVRTLHGFNSAGKEIKLITIIRGEKGTKAVYKFSTDEYLKANIDRLGFKLSGKGLKVTREVTAAMVKAKKEALNDFTFSPAIADKFEGESQEEAEQAMKVDDDAEATVEEEEVSWSEEANDGDDEEEEVEEK